MELQPTKTLLNGAQWFAAVRTVIDRNIDSVPAEKQQSVKRSLPANIETGLMGFLASTHKNAEPQDVAALIIEAWRKSLQSERGAGHPQFQPMLADFVQYVKNFFGIELPLPQPEQPEPAPVIESAPVTVVPAARPFMNVDARYGNPEMCNIGDYRDLNPDGEFYETSDGIFEIVDGDKIQVATLPDLLTVTEAADRAAVTVRYIRADIAAGRLPARKLGAQWVITRADFLAWMANPRRGSRR